MGYVLPWTQILSAAHSFILCVVLCGIAPAFAQSPEFERACENTLAPAYVAVDAEFRKWSLDKSVGLLELQKKAGGLAKNGTVLGLTTANLSISFEWKENIHVKDGQSCMRPRILARMAIVPQTVYVAREFEQNACVYEDILAHEMRHVRVNQDYLKRAARHLERSLSDFFGDRIFYGDGPTMKRQLEAAIRESWMPMAQEVFNQSSVAHARIDSREEYARNQTICSSAVPRILRGIWKN